MCIRKYAQDIRRQRNTRDQINRFTNKLCVCVCVISHHLSVLPKRRISRLILNSTHPGSFSPLREIGSAQAERCKVAHLGLGFRL